MKSPSAIKFFLSTAFWLVALSAAGQSGIPVNLPESVFLSKIFELDGGIFAVGDRGDLESRHYEVFQLQNGNDFQRCYVSPERRIIWKTVSDQAHRVFIVSFYAASARQRYFISALNEKMEPQWDYEIEGRTTQVNSITPDMQGGCFVNMQLDGELKFVHLNAYGTADWSPSFGIGPVKEFIFQLDISSGGLFGFVTTRSELSGVLNRCTADYDYLGFVGHVGQAIDTLFFTDVHPYSNFMRYEIMESPPGGKTFLIKAQFKVDPTKSSMLECEHFGMTRIDFLSLQQEHYPLVHANRMMYTTGEKSMTVWDVEERVSKTIPMEDSLGYPQRLLASQEEDGIIWNAIGSDRITKYSLDLQRIWSSKIPYPPEMKAKVIQIGYRTSGGYFVVTQADVGGQVHYFELGLDGKWVK